MDPHQRAQLARDGYCVVDQALSAEVICALNERFAARLAAERPASALAWYLNRGAEGAPGAPRQLWHTDLIAPPKVVPILRELCSSLEWGHMHPQCPTEHRGHFRLDHGKYMSVDNAHCISPFSRPEHSPDCCL
jgi:hypothetical protein